MSADSQRIKTLEDELMLVIGERDGLASKLLDVQQEAVAVRRHWRACEEGWNRVILQAETFQRERDDALIAHSEVRGQLGVEVAKRVEAIDRWDTSFREMEGLAKQVLAERNEAREERDDAQQTIDAMRAEGCPARGLVENIFNGLTSHGQPTSPLLAEMAEAAAKLLVDVPVCEHKDELKRLKEVVYNYFDFTPSCDENNKCFACGEQWYPNECTSTCLATMLFTAIKEGKDTSIVWLELSDELDDARAILDKVRALCDDYSKPMGRRHVLALLPPRAVIQAEAEEAAKRKEVPPDGE